MKNFPRKLIESYCESIVQLPNRRLYLFDTLLKDEALHTLQRKTPAEMIGKGFKADTLIYKHLVIKHEYRSLRKRLKFLYFNSHPARGHCGISGEAINTLAANRINYPAHQLVALDVHNLTGKIQAVYSRITDAVPLELLLNDAAADIDDMILHVIKALLATLDSGILHGDCNISNLFYRPASKTIVLIDLELAVQINCEKHIAAAVLLCGLYDHRLQSLMTAERFIALLQKILPENFSASENDTLLKLFNHYRNRRLSREERDERLAQVSKGNPAVGYLLQRHAAKK